MIEQVLGNNAVEHRVSKKLETLVVGGAKTAMGQRLPQQVGLGEFMPQLLRQTCSAHRQRLFAFLSAAVAGSLEFDQHIDVRQQWNNLAVSNRNRQRILVLGDIQIFRLE